MNPYIAGGAALALIVMGVLLKNAYERTGGLETKLEVQVEETIEAVQANHSNMTTITTLKKRIETMIEERRVDTERREKILVEREAELVAARTENDTLRGEREDEQEENADCADLASLRVDLFCPATAEQLRKRSRGAGTHEDGDST